jgi:hypothetical protein
MTFESWQQEEELEKKKEIEKQMQALLDRTTINPDNYKIQIDGMNIGQIVFYDMEISDKEQANLDSFSLTEEQIHGAIMFALKTNQSNLLCDNALEILDAAHWLPWGG